MCAEGPLGVDFPQPPAYVDWRGDTISRLWQFYDTLMTSFAYDRQDDLVVW